MLRLAIILLGLTAHADGPAPGQVIATIRFTATVRPTATAAIDTQDVAPGLRIVTASYAISHFPGARDAWEGEWFVVGESDRIVVSDQGVDWGGAIAWRSDMPPGEMLAGFTGEP